MAHRACLSLLLALVVSLAALISLREADSARADSIAQNAVHAQSVDLLANSPPNGGDLAAVVGQWTDDDPDDILQAGSISIAFPPLTSGFGRRVGQAVARERHVSAAFPRGPPSI